MTAVLSAAGRSFLRAFLGSLIILAPGVASAPNLNRAFALGVSALIASIAAGLRVIQVFIPQLTVAAWVKQPWGTWIDSFLRVFLASFLTSIIPILNAPDLSTWRSLTVAALIGAVTAGLRVVQGLTTKGESPAVTTGLEG